MGNLPFLLRTEDGVIGVLVVRVGEIAMDRSAGFMLGDQGCRRNSRSCGRRCHQSPQQADRARDDAEVLRVKGWRGELRMGSGTGWMAGLYHPRVVTMGYDGLVAGAIVQC